MNLPNGVTILVTAAVTTLIGIIVAVIVVWNLAGTQIVFAITHRGETETCRVNLQKALNNPLMQPVINSQK